MSFVGDFLGDTIGGITGAKQSARAAERAAGTQARMVEQGIDEQRAQFDKLVELLSPYREAGIPALQQQQALAGTLGADAQRAAIAQIEQSPITQALMRQGEDALLQNASATGGLRGGNTQAALGMFRPNVLNQMIEQQYGRLGGLAQMGQASATGQATQGMQVGANVANLLGNQGAALAGGQLARGNVARQAFGDAMAIGSAAASAMTGMPIGGLGGMFGGSTQMPQFGQTFNGMINLGGGR